MPDGGYDTGERLTRTLIPTTSSNGLLLSVEGLEPPPRPLQGRALPLCYMVMYLRGDRTPDSRLMPGALLLCHRLLLDYGEVQPAELAHVPEGT